MNAFQTPEEIAKADNIRQLAESLDSPSSSAVDINSPQNMKKNKKLNWMPNKRTIFISMSVVIVTVAGVVSYAMKNSSSPVVLSDKKPINNSNLIPSALSGLPVEPTLNQKTVTGVMIENTPQARPQAGLGQASVVFEAIAEAGITRFLALFQDTAPSNVGPIRSARPYYAQWALGFDSTYAHVGGSPKALANIKQWGVKDLDQFRNSGAYHRASNRPAPHNMYSSIPKLNQLENSKGFNSSKFTGFFRKKDTPSKTPDAQVINLNISQPAYNVRYQYNPASNSYNRSQGGSAHIDANTNAQISPKVVIALVLPYSLEADGYHSIYNTLGSGTVYIFQDGKVTTGQWTKPTNDKQFKFTDTNGKIIKLNAGQTWLTAIDANNKVTYSP